MTMGDFVLVQQSLFDHLRQHCENCHDFDGSLEVLPDGRVVFVPSRRCGPTSKRKSSPVTGPPQTKKTRLRVAEAALSWFLQKAPKASGWRTRQIELDLKTVEQYESVIRAFGNVADIRREASYEDANSGDKLVHLAERLALLTKKSLANAELQRSFALFQVLILLSYCQVLKKRHVPFHEIDRVIGHIATNEKDRKKILNGALRINEIINKLVDNGWTIYRATELFFINALSINNLKSIYYENNIPLLLDHLKSDDFVGHDYYDCLGPKYTIPGLISCLLSTCSITANQISIEEICNALGYPLDRVSQSVYTVHAISADGSVAAHSLRFEVLDPSSFGTSESFNNQSQSLTRTRLPLSSPSSIPTMVSAHDITTTGNRHIVDTLLSTSKFEGLINREKLLALATHSQNPAEIQIHGEIVHEISVRLRSRGHIYESEDVITEFLNSQTFDSDEESRRVLGRLSLSQAYNRIYQFDFAKAREESCKWQPSSETLSDHELRLLCDQLRTTGRILRGEGRFGEAMGCFEGCLSTSGLPKSKRTLVICHLSDVYCELEYMQRITASTSELQLEYFNEGRKITEPEIEHERASNQHSRSFRRLLLSLAEIEIRQSCFDKADSLLSELLDIYGTLDEPDVDDKVGHVRALISRARISQLSDAEDNWTAALLQNKTYNPEEEEVFTCGVIYLFISLTRFRRGNGNGSQDMFHKAVEVIRSKRPQFLMPGLGTYLFDYVRLELESKASFVLPEIAY